MANLDFFSKTYETLEDVPEEVRDWYVEKEGKPELSKQGHEYFTQARASAKAQEELLAAQKSTESLKAANDEIAKLKAQIGEFEKDKEDPSGGNKLDLEEVEKRIKERSDAVAQEYEAKMAKIQSDADQAVEKANAKLLFAEVSSAASAAGILPGLIDRHLVNRMAEKGWTVDESGKIQLLQDGMPVHSRKNPSKNMEMLEWLQADGNLAPEFYKTSTGGGAQGSGPSRRGGPRHKEDFTSQAEKYQFQSEQGWAAYMALPDAPKK